MTSWKEDLQLETIVTSESLSLAINAGLIVDQEAARHRNFELGCIYRQDPGRLTEDDEGRLYEIQEWIAEHIDTEGWARRSDDPIEATWIGVRSSRGDSPLIYVGPVHPEQIVD